MRPLRGAVAVALALAVLCGAPLITDATGCPAQLYVQQVQQASADVAATPPHAAAATALLQSAVQQHPEAAAILQPVLDDLQLQPPALSDAQSRLAALSSVLALPAGSTCDVDSAPALNTLHSVYASPEFAGLDTTQQPSLLQLIGDALSSVVSHLLSALGTGGSIALGLVVLAAIAALVVWRVRSRLGSRAAQLPAEPAEAGDDPDAERAAARAAAQRGEYREAIRRAFRGALLEVVLRGRMRVDRAWTTRELLAEARGDAGLLTALAAAADSFDTAWYSGHPVSEADWEVARSRCDAVRSLARHNSAVHPA